MAQNSCDGYSTLLDNVLNRYIAPIGMKTTAELAKKSFVKSTEYLLKKMNISNDKIHNIQYYMKLFSDNYCENIFFETNFETYFDSHPPFELDEAILTGSMSEGLFDYRLHPPDMDFMCVLKNISFSQEDQENGNLQLKDDTPFVYAFVSKIETQHLWNEYFDVAYVHVKKRRLSSRKLKEKLAEKYKKAEKLFHSTSKEAIDAEGPAVTITKENSSYNKIRELIRKRLKQLLDADEENLDSVSVRAILDAFLLSSSDLVLSIFCEGWPKCAREWITRERIWPDMHIVEKIAKTGFHIVPKSSPDGDFRLSFSCAETMLIEALSPLQHRVLLAFKSIFKYHQNKWFPADEEIISSYFLKTIAFWYFEETSPEFWTEESTVHHLVTLLEKLQNALRYQNLPMYFMPKVNLLQNLNDPEVAIDLMGKIYALSQDFSAMAESSRSIFDII